MLREENKIKNFRKHWWRYILLSKQKFVLCDKKRIELKKTMVKSNLNVNQTILCN